MSYILDALKRADAERERGHVPGLHSQRTASLTSAPASPRRKRSSAALMGGVATLLLLAAAVWWWQTAPGAHMPPPPTATAPAPVPLPAPEPVPVTTQATEATPPPAPALPILAPELATSPRSAREPPPTPPKARTSTGSATPTAASPVEPTAPANGASNGNGNVRSFAELAPEIRAQLPQVSVSGSTYSSNPAHRMLIANGKVVHEGEEIAPGLQLETIGPGKAVLNHRGTRYSIGY